MPTTTLKAVLVLYVDAYRLQKGREALLIFFLIESYEMWIPLGMK